MKQKLFQHLKHAQKLKKEGIHIEPDEKDTNRFYAMIIGGIDTPYQHGFYMFTFDFTRDYPTYPPEVTFHNTNIVNRGRVHPNCYQSALKGKVCLSLIGTWGKNTWNPNTSSFGEILSRFSEKNAGLAKHKGLWVVSKGKPFFKILLFSRINVFECVYATECSVVPPP